MCAEGGGGQVGRGVHGLLGAKEIPLSDSHCYCKMVAARERGVQIAMRGIDPCLRGHVFLFPAEQHSSLSNVTVNSGKESLYWWCYMRRIAW